MISRVWRRAFLMSLLWSALLLVVGACSPIPGAETTAAPPAPSATPELTFTSSPVPPTPTIAPTPTPDRSILAGLAYRTAEGLWVFDSEGTPGRLSEHPGAVPAPGGDRWLYVDDDDVWMGGAGLEEPRLLADTPVRGECCPQWWPGGPDVVLFSSWPHPGTEPNTGLLTAVGVDGSGYRVLEREELSLGPPAPAPHTQLVAYDRMGEPWLYDWVAGPRPFFLEEFGVEDPGDLKFASPSWSLDGMGLAWMTIGTMEGEWATRVGVFDLARNTVRWLHQHAGLDGDGWPPPVVWSPDGSWLALEEWQTGELWLLRADGTEERLLGAGSGPVWSPDGARLAYAARNGGEAPTLLLVDPASPEAGGLDFSLPEEAQLVDWLAAP